jgi:hypothetical protein
MQMPMNLPDATKILEYLISIIYLLNQWIKQVVGGMIFPSLVLTNEALKPCYYSLVSYFPKPVAEFLGNLSPLAVFFESFILTYLIFFLWLAFCTRNDSSDENRIDGGGGDSPSSALPLAAQEKKRCYCPICTISSLSFPAKVKQLFPFPAVPASLEMEQLELLEKEQLEQLEKEKKRLQQAEYELAKQERYDHRIRETLLQELEKGNGNGEATECNNLTLEEALQLATPLQRFLLDIVNKQEEILEKGGKETPLKEIFTEIDQFVLDQQKKNWGEDSLSANISPAEIDTIILKRAKERIKSLSEQEERELLSIDFFSCPYDTELGLSAGGQRRMDRWLDERYHASTNIALYEQQLRKGYQKFLEYEQVVLTWGRAEQEKAKVRESDINNALGHAINLFNKGKALTKAAKQERASVAEWKYVSSQRNEQHVANLEKILDNLINEEKKKLLNEFQEAVAKQLEIREKHLVEIYGEEARRAVSDRKDIQKLYTARLVQHKIERDKARFELEKIRSQIFFSSNSSKKFFYSPIVHPPVGLVVPAETILDDADKEKDLQKFTSQMDIYNRFAKERETIPSNIHDEKIHEKEPNFLSLRVRTNSHTKDASVPCCISKLGTPEREVDFDKWFPYGHRTYFPLNPELTPLLPTIDEEKQEVFPLTERDTQLVFSLQVEQVENIPTLKRLPRGKRVSALEDIAEAARQARLLQDGVSPLGTPKGRGMGMVRNDSEISNAHQEIHSGQGGFLGGITRGKDSEPSENDSFESIDPSQWRKQAAQDQRKADLASNQGNAMYNMSDSEFQELAKSYRTDIENPQLIHDSFSASQREHVNKILSAWELFALQRKDLPFQEEKDTLGKGNNLETLNVTNLNREKKGSTTEKWKPSLPTILEEGVKTDFIQKPIEKMAETCLGCTSQLLPNSDTIFGEKGKLFTEPGAASSEAVNNVEAVYNVEAVKNVPLHYQCRGKDTETETRKIFEFYSSVSAEDLFQKRMQVAVEQKLLPPLPALWSHNSPPVREVISTLLPLEIVRDLVTLPLGIRDPSAVKRLKNSFLEQLKLTHVELSQLTLDEYFDYLYLLGRGVGIQDLFTNLTPPKSEENLFRAFQLFLKTSATFCPNSTESDYPSFILSDYPQLPFPMDLHNFLEKLFPFPFQMDPGVEFVESESGESESVSQDQEAPWGCLQPASLTDYKCTAGGSENSAVSTPPVSPRILEPPESLNLSLPDEESCWGSPGSSIPNFTPRTPDSLDFSFPDEESSWDSAGSSIPNYSPSEFCPNCDTNHFSPSHLSCLSFWQDKQGGNSLSFFSREAESSHSISLFHFPQSWGRVDTCFPPSQIFDFIDTSQKKKGQENIKSHPIDDVRVNYSMSGLRTSETGRMSLLFDDFLFEQGKNTGEISQLKISHSSENSLDHEEFSLPHQTPIVSLRGSLPFPALFFPDCVSLGEPSPSPAEQPPAPQAAHLSCDSPALATVATERVALDGSTTSPLEQEGGSTLGLTFQQYWKKHWKPDSEDILPLDGARLRSISFPLQQSEKKFGTPLLPKIKQQKCKQVGMDQQELCEIFPVSEKSSAIQEKSPRNVVNWEGVSFQNTPLEEAPADLQKEVSDLLTLFTLEKIYAAIPDSKSAEILTQIRHNLSTTIQHSFYDSQAQIEEMRLSIQDQLGSDLDTVPLPPAGTARANFCYGRNKLTEAGILKAVGLKKDALHALQGQQDTQGMGIGSKQEFPDVPTDWWDSLDGGDLLDVLLRLVS